MNTSAPDPLIHDPGRLRVIATQAALPDGDALALTRLPGMPGLTPGSLITRLRELKRAGYGWTDGPAWIAVGREPGGSGFSPSLRVNLLPRARRAVART